jgi:UDP-N-acetylmuramate dehydrogenase
MDLEPGELSEGEALLSEIVRWRREHQPGGQNAGSVFTNPPGDSAGRLIDAAGGKGLRIGTAQVSDKHANFIQADPKGSADDVLTVMRRVQTLVREHAGIELEPETRLVGFSR